MADIELMIKINAEQYKFIKENIPEDIAMRFPALMADICARIANGTPLPKGHGRLIDADALPLNDIDDANYGSNYIRIAPTIIEADKE